MVEETTKKYKIISILRPALSAEKASEAVHQVLSQYGVSVLNEESYNRALAYKIDKNDRAHFVTMNIESDPAQISMIRKKISENEKFLRVLITKQINFEITEDSLKPYLNNVTRRGRILIQRKMSRKRKSLLTNGIKVRRFLGLLHYCNYYV